MEGSNNTAALLYMQRAQADPPEGGFRPIQVFRICSTLIASIYWGDPPEGGSPTTMFFRFCSTLTASHNGLLESFSDDGQFTYHVIVVEI